MPVRPEIWLVYDGECPLCQLGARHLRLQESLALHLVDARTESAHPVMRELTERGFDLDEGMVVKTGMQFYQGAQALQLLADLSEGGDRLNRLHAWMFRSRNAARLCYPIFKAGRMLALRLKGVPRLRNLEK